MAAKGGGKGGGEGKNKGKKTKTAEGKNICFKCNNGACDHNACHFAHIC